jgi:hypothetical protein
MKSLVGQRQRYEDNIKMKLHGIISEDVKWMGPVVHFDAKLLIFVVRAGYVIDGVQYGSEAYSYIHC